MASHIVTASQSYEECRLTGTPSRCASVFERVFGSIEASCSELAYSTGLNEATFFRSASLGSSLPDVLGHHASSDKAQSSESTTTPHLKVPEPISDEPNWW